MAPSVVAHPRSPAPGALAPFEADATAHAFRTRSVALGVLARDAELMARSRQLLQRSRALCAPPAAPVAPSRRAAVPRQVAALALGLRRATGTASEQGCARSGCGSPALYRPTFVVGVDARHVALPNIVLRVCAHHRDQLMALFREPRVRDAFRRLLHARGCDASGEVRVAFQTVN